MSVGPLTSAGRRTGPGAPTDWTPHRAGGMIARMTDAPPDLRRAALLITDAQRAFLDPAGPIGAASRGALDAAGEADLVVTWRRLMTAARAAGCPVVLARTAFRPDHADCAWPPDRCDELHGPGGSLLVEGTPGTAWVDGFRPEEGDVVLTRTGPSAFFGTPLDRILANLGVDTLLLAGGPLTSALADTAHNAAGLGYRVHIVTDAVFPPTAAPPFASAAQPIASATVLEAFPGRARGAGGAAVLAPAPGRESAYVVVDMQNHFLAPATADEGERARVRGIVERTALLAARARDRGWPVIWVVTGRRADRIDSAMHRLREADLLGARSLLVDGTPGAALADGLVPAADDLVIAKRGQSSFAFTPLHRVLRNLGVGHCLVAGGAVTGCLGATVRDGAALGYRITVAADATYPVDSPHLGALAGYAHLEGSTALLAAGS